MNHCLFEIDSQLFGVAIQDVIKIIPCVQLVPLPRSSQNVMGLHSFRGGVICVVTLEHRLNLKLRSLKNSFLLVMEHSTGLIALVVDLVKSVETFTDSDLIEVDDPLIEAKIIAENRSILLLNTDTLLNLGPEK